MKTINNKQKIEKLRCISTFALDFVMMIIVLMFKSIVEPISLLFLSISGTLLIISTLIFVVSVYKYKKLKYNW